MSECVSGRVDEWASGQVADWVSGRLVDGRLVGVRVSELVSVLFDIRKFLFFGLTTSTFHILGRNFYNFLSCIFGKF